MTIEQCVENIEISLGAPIVEVEIKDLLYKIVHMALRELSRYITETRYMTVNYSKTGIDLKDKHVNTIVQLFRAVNPNQLSDITEVYAFNASNYSTANTSTLDLLMTDYFYRTQVSQIKSTISTDLDFTYDKEEQKLYVNTFYPVPSKITIVYIPEFYQVDDIHEQYWINYLNRLALAFAKITLGRVRGKYDLSSSLYKLDGNTLIAEGIAERDQIRTELNDNSDIVLPMD